METFLWMMLAVAITLLVVSAIMGRRHFGYKEAKDAGLIGDKATTAAAIAGATAAIGPKNVTVVEDHRKAVNANAAVVKELTARLQKANSLRAVLERDAASMPASE